MTHQDISLREKAKKVLRKWYKGYETEMPNEYCMDKLLSLIKKEILKGMPKEEVDFKNQHIFQTYWNRGYNKALSVVKKYLKDLLT